MWRTMRVRDRIMDGCLSLVQRSLACMDTIRQACVHACAWVVHHDQRFARQFGCARHACMCMGCTPGSKLCTSAWVCTVEVDTEFVDQHRARAVCSHRHAHTMLVRNQGTCSAEVRLQRAVMVCPPLRVPPVGVLRARPAISEHARPCSSGDSEHLHVQARAHTPGAQCVDVSTAASVLFY